MRCMNLSEWQAAARARLVVCMVLALALLASGTVEPTPANAAILDADANEQRTAQLVDLTGDAVVALEAVLGGDRDEVCELDVPATVRTARIAAPTIPTLHESSGLPLPFGGMELVPLLGMVALAKDRNTPARDGKVTAYPVKAGAKIYAGALVVADAGYAAPGRTAVNLIALGRANHQADNSAGGDGDLTVEVQRGVFLFANDGTITQADVGKDAYIVDDQTVANNDGGSTRSKAGVIRGVEVGGVWVEI